MTSKIKVNNIEDTSGNALVTKCGSTLTLGKSGDTISLASGASQSGFGRSGSVNWQTTIKTGNFNAVSGEGYFINTTSGAITMTLPASPSAGDIVAFKDYANTFDTNNCTIGRNGSKIGGTEEDAVISVEGQAGTLVYGDATQGWQIVQAATDGDLPRPLFVTATGGTITTQCTNFKVHTFTSPGTFQVTCAGNAQGSNTLEYLVVGAGGGSARDNAGGAGAGGVRFFASCLPSPSPASPRNAPAGLTASVASFPITIGAGGGPGSAKSPNSEPGDRGSGAVFSTITSTGGGGSSGDGQSSSPNNPGGSGAGRGQASGQIGSGNTPPVSPPQGSDGGGDGGNPGGGGGGGGFMAVGSNRSGDTGGAGGAGGGFSGTYFGANGVPCGSFRYFGGGGGGGSGQPGSGGAGAGGLGGGGAGGATNGNPGNGGTANTGGGSGGGGQAGEGAIGGSAIVVIRYKFQ